MPLKVRDVIKDAIAFHIEGMLEAGLPIPPRYTAAVVEVNVEASAIV